ncbi:MAG: cyclodeaminase/cyclohydrolase family protein [Candidatus Thermoplasmatota archaeon]
MTKLVELKINDFLDELASKSPAPGGASVAALSGSLSSALSSMVCNLTLGKEKYQDAQEDIKKALENSEKLREEITQLIDEDTNAFNDVIKAFKMPKETEEEKKLRKKAIQKGYKKAAEIPLKTAEKCEKILDIAEIVANKGNQNSITDAAVSALVAKAAVSSALLNVKINLSSIKDKNYVEKISQKIQTLEEKSTVKKDKIMKKVEEKI